MFFFSFPKHETPITKLATGIYKQKPCIISLSANEISLYALDSYEKLTDVLLDNTTQSNNTILSRPITTTNLSSGFIRSLWANINEIHYLNGIHYEISYWDFESNRNMFGLGNSANGQTFSQKPGGLGSEYKGIKIVESIDDNLVALGYEDGSIKVLNIGTGHLTPFGEHQNLTCLTALNDDAFVSGSLDGTIKIWGGREEAFNQDNPIVSLLSLDEHTLVIGSKSKDADVDVPLQGSLFRRGGECNDIHLNFFGNIAKVNSNTIAYLENLETLSVTVYNIETQEKLTVQPSPPIKVSKNTLFDTSKVLLATYCGKIIITVPSLNDSNQYFFVSDQAF